MGKGKFAVAAGHPATRDAAVEILSDGGNAFDAIIAAHFAACIAEPVLCSLAGGGFLLASTGGTRPEVYDFFTQTPMRALGDGQIEFRPVMADFGTAQQQFHIGAASTATPGCVSGLFDIHRERGSLPMQRLVEPAVALARDGLLLNDFQAYIFSIVEPIYMSTEAARSIFADPGNRDHIVSCGRRMVQTQQADFIESLAREGEALFYQGEVAQAIAQLQREHGGHLTLDDLSAYRTLKREPQQLKYRDAILFTNPPPSSGGLLIAFALDLLAQTNPSGADFDSEARLQLLADVMALTREARLECSAADALHPDAGLMRDESFLTQYRTRIRGRARCYRGTTHISIIDAEDNIASMTISNGEGSGHLVPGTGVMLNNMLGEEDINPGGFNCWPLNQRMTSMMSPTIMLFDDGREVALGSGGSNRIRSAILQVVSNLVDFRMSVADAVAAPRIHLEGEHLSIEGGFSASSIAALQQRYPDTTVWDSINLFFGGAHTVVRDGNSFAGAGDPRRGGVAATGG